MITTEKKRVTVEANIHAPVEKVWECWTKLNHIIHWNHASDDWLTPRAENDFRTGGKLVWRMEARDGSSGFDFQGTYGKIVPYKLIEYTIADGRKVQLHFIAGDNTTTVTEIFEAEQQNSIELQQTGWQAILDNFKKYVEAQGTIKPLHFEISIEADPHKVYTTMLDAKKFTEWTAEFNPSSHFRGSWEKRSKILFIGTDENGNEGGMVSRIRENIPGNFVSIEHLGMIKDGKELTTGPEVEKWAGAQENYSFKAENGFTRLTIDIDSNEEFESYFKETWPKVLKRLKEICEAQI